MRYLIVVTREHAGREQNGDWTRAIETDELWYVGDDLIVDDLTLVVQAAIAGPTGYEATLYCSAGPGDAPDDG